MYLPRNAWRSPVLLSSDDLAWLRRFTDSCCLNPSHASAFGRLFVTTRGNTCLIRLAHGCCTIQTRAIARRYRFRSAVRVISSSSTCDFVSRPAVRSVFSEFVSIGARFARPSCGGSLRSPPCGSLRSPQVRVSTLLHCES